MKYFQRLFILMVFLLSGQSFAESSTTSLKPFKADLNDQASLQRGARIFVNYCSGCHSLRYMRYNRLGEDLGLVGSDGKLDKHLLEKNLIFTDEPSSAAIIGSIDAVDAQHWFGVAPPDLTLITKIRGQKWVYNYLRGFYQDPARLTGANNWLLPNTAMPNILVELQGIQTPVYRQAGKEKLLVIDHLVLVHSGLMTPLQFDSTIYDVVNFLTYTAEPQQNKRYQIGKWVLIFLLIFAILTYYLKKAYWKTIDK